MNNVHNISSTSMIAAEFHHGSQKALDHFFHLYYPSLCFFAKRLTGDEETAKEIASFAFVKTWQKRDRLFCAADIRAYLYTVVRNDCYKWLQQQKKERALQQQLAVAAPPEEQSHLDAMVHAETLRELYRHFRQLSRGQQLVFEKLYREGKSTRQTAEELSLQVSTVKTQKARALVVLRGRLSMGG